MPEATSNTPSNRTGPTRFVPELESLRGIAALIVVVGHCYGILPRSDPPELALQPLLLWFAEDVLGQGILSVMFFFALSGFVLGVQLSGAPVRTFSDYVRYLARRLFRLVPAVWASLLFTMLVFYLDGNMNRFTSVEILKNFFFLSNTMNDVLWTMHVEIIISAVFPLLYFAFSRSQPFVRIATLFALETLYMQAPVNGDQSLRLIVWFYIGLMAGATAHLFSGMSRLERALCVLVIASGYFFKHYLGDLGVMLGIYLILSMTIAYAGKPNTLLLRSAPLRFLGKISYSVYLLHMPVKNVFFDIVIVRMLGIDFSRDNLMISHSLIFIGTVVVIIPLAYLSYRFIELPFMRIGKQLESRLPKGGHSSKYGDSEPAASIN